MTEQLMSDLANTPIIKDSTDETFLVDVIEASKEMPILVDFWAPWCGPCKTIGPALEEAVIENSKKIKLVKIDIDKNPNIAGQLRVQSIPAVFAFSNGQPVDGFMGAQTPGQIKQFIEKIIKSYGPEDNDLSSAVESANEMLEENNISGAIEVFEAVKAQDPNLTDAHFGLIKSFLANKDIAAAKDAYDAIPESIRLTPDIKTALAQIQIAEQTLTAGKLADIEEQLLLSPKDLKIKFDLAMAFMSENRTQDAINTLLEIIKTEPSWNGGKAKNRLVELLDALGPKDPVGRTGRRNLSSILFS
tara:strand:- start:4511 stop:5419 length:909 start_codon:yes stop_codon:yes gene_type:complete